jgi:hypothetical protein
MGNDLQTDRHYSLTLKGPNWQEEAEKVMMRNRISIISFFVLLFTIPSVFGQSVADLARQNRPKDAKVTSQRVFTDDDVKHTACTFALQKAPTTISIEDLEKKVDEVASKTARQSGEEFARDIQFPGRDRWEQDLYNKKEALVAATRIWIILKRSDKSTKDSLDRAASDQGIADRAYTDLQAKGIVEAAKWEKR